jgi:hypothetical protein
VSLAELCGTCGQPLRVPLAYCTCGHLELSHELNRAGVRTACWHYRGPRGVRCGCRHYERAEMT